MISKENYNQVSTYKITTLSGRTHCLLLAFGYCILILPTLVAQAIVDELDNVLGVLRLYFKLQVRPNMHAR